MKFEVGELKFIKISNNIVRKFSEYLGNFDDIKLVGS